MPLNPQLLRSAGVAALGSFLFGFDTAVISGATEALRLTYALSSQALGLTVASALLGTILGSLGVGPPLETYGRRPVLRALAVLYFVSAVGCGLAWSWSALVVFRFIGGLAIGGSSVAAPMYIAEIAPAAQRGRLVAHQPAQHRRRHPGRLPVELDRRTAAGRARVRGLARDARRAGAAGGALLRVARHRARESALADQAAAAPGGRGRCCAVSAARRRRRWRPRSPSRCIRRPCRPTSRSSRASTGGRSCWR